jgi:hypothetical protein
MRAATSERVISIMALVLVISIGFLAPKAAAQSDKYSTFGKSAWNHARVKLGNYPEGI